MLLRPASVADSWFTSPWLILATQGHWRAPVDVSWLAIRPGCRVLGRAVALSRGVPSPGFLVWTRLGARPRGMEYIDLARRSLS